MSVSPPPAGTHPVRLSKSKIAAFEHCPKRLWLQIHRCNEAKFDDTTLMRFQFGHDVGKRARLLVPDGILIETGMDMTAALQWTDELIGSGYRGPIFEATFVHDNVLVRADILQPHGDDAWEMIEVKGSSRVSGYQLADLATQVWVARGCDINVAKATIRYLAKRVQWWRPDIGNVTFCDADVTRDIERFITDRPRLASAAAATLCGGEPEQPMGLHCHRPLACEFRDHCGRSPRKIEAAIPVTNPPGSAP